METFYLIIVIFIFLIAIFDLSVGVSNDAVNFLNSAIGAKAAPFKVIMAVAAIGIFVGASMSNGMMDIARHGIYQPQYFYMNEIMSILLAVMLTDVVLLDIFNTMGLPTSTTVSMIFALLGGTFALAIVKTINSAGALQMGDLINTDKALQVIVAIFVSVAIAFFFGVLVQYIARLIFKFNYRKQLKYFGALFGGFAATSIIYFILIKGLKESTLMTPENRQWIHDNTQILLGCCFLCTTILMQVLMWCRINILKIVVLLGTFALALAFAGNDLVNFIGMPLAGYSTYHDYIANSNGVSPDQYLMTSLLDSASTPSIFLIGSGIIMVVALLTSKKAHNVIKTSLDLSRQEAGEESFGTSPIARKLVRMTTNTSSFIVNNIPPKARTWLNARFDKDEVILEHGAAFDLIRASVNLVLASLLIALGTSLKLPLSTTYVTFMVAMGTSLADRAWGRDSAVYRITGVISVIGGWFLTAGAAFLICFTVTMIVYFGGSIAIILLGALAAYMLIHSQISYNKKLKQEKNSSLAQQMVANKDKQEALVLLRKFSREEFAKVLEWSANLAIKGNVTPKPSQPVFTYPYSIGDLKLHTKTVLFSSIRPEETLGEKINIKNEGKTSATIHLGKVPHYLNVQVNPATLQPDEVGAITILMDAKVLKRKGRVSTLLPIMIQSAGKKEVSGEIQISANVIDNFSKLSAADKAQAPIAELSGTLLEFGKLPNKKSIVPLIGGKVSGTFEITNAGKTPLTIYSVTCDDERVDLSGGKKELKPGATATFKVTLRPKEIKTKLEALINVVCNDPNGPIRLIKVTAYK